MDSLYKFIENDTWMLSEYIMTSIIACYFKKTGIWKVKFIDIRRILNEMKKMRLELFIIFLYFISVNATHLHEIVQVEKNEPGGVTLHTACYPCVSNNLRKHL